jgi:PilZ domain
MRVRIHDLSLGGCLIEAPLSIEVGRRLTLRFDLPGEDWLSLQGEAVRMSDRMKFAIKFIDMDAAKENRLQRVIDRLSVASSTPTPSIDASIDGS